MPLSPDTRTKLRKFLRDLAKDVPAEFKDLVDPKSDFHLDVPGEE